MKSLMIFCKQVVIIIFLILALPFVYEVKAQPTDENGVNWISYADAIKQAEEKKVMVFLEAEWCVVCKRMHKEVFTDNEVFSLINRDFFAVKMDIESQDRIPVNGNMVSKMEYSKSIGIYGTPTILFLDRNEDIIGNFVGYSDSGEMVTLLTYIVSDAYLTESLEEYTNP